MSYCSQAVTLIGCTAERARSPGRTVAPGVCRNVAANGEPAVSVAAGAPASSLRQLPGRGFAPPGHGALGWCGPANGIRRPQRGCGSGSCPSARSAAGKTASSSSPCWQWRRCVAEPILVVSERGVGKHIGNIFSKLDLAPSAADHRRVLVGSPLPGALTGDTAGTISLTMPARPCSATAPRWRAACRCLPGWAAGGSAGSRVFRAALRS